jgi:Cys-rich four helix bundle protein (predicted Tat secretion target)
VTGGRAGLWRSLGWARATHNDAEDFMDRREFIIASASVIGAGAATRSLAQAQDKEQGAADASKGTAPGYAKNKELADAAAECVRTGNVCLEHCLTLLRSGDKSIAKCSATVAQLVPMCRALEALAIQDATQLKAHAATCGRVCRECEVACKVHASHHESCRRCMESCQRCGAACEKMAA